MGVSETGRKCLLPTGVTLGSKEPVSHSVHKREQSLLGALRGETRILPPGQSGVSVDEERGFRWRLGCIQSTVGTERGGGRGSKAAWHLETETQAVGAGGWDTRTRDLAWLGHCAISGPRIMTGTRWESPDICRVSECQERSLRGYDRRLTGELDLGNRGAPHPSPVLGTCVLLASLHPEAAPRTQP